MVFDLGALGGDDQHAPDGCNGADDQEGLGHQLVRFQRKRHRVDDFHGHHDQQDAVKDLDGLGADLAAHHGYVQCLYAGEEQQYGQNGQDDRYDEQDHALDSF